MIHLITASAVAALALIGAAWVDTGGGTLNAEGQATPRVATPAGPVGIFEAHGDIGMVLHAGSTTFDDAAKSYTVAGSGENMWFAKDAFHFAWKKVSGDCSPDGRHLVSRQRARTRTARRA